ncbi:hypothetical protein [Nonomuraea sp. KM90]|uniref:hypothetical protein n=1 Tax=Nonomuraea sp. KM90 TaxID=3457428 RepID=UPI003FCEBC56
MSLIAPNTVPLPHDIAAAAIAANASAHAHDAIAWSVVANTTADDITTEQWNARLTWIEGELLEVARVALEECGQSGWEALDENTFAKVIDRMASWATQQLSQ